MTIREAIEAMKIVAPHSDGLHLERSNIGVIRAITKRVGETPSELIRLLALMERRTLEDVVQEYADNRDPGLLVVRIGLGFRRNPLDLLVNAAYQLGLTSAGWEDA